MRDRPLQLGLLFLAAMFVLALRPASRPAAAHASRPADTTVTLFPMADAFVDEQFPATNHNTLTTAVIPTTAAMVLMTFLRRTIPA